MNSRLTGWRAILSWDGKEALVAYDEGLAQRIHEALAESDGLGETKMFGGLAFMLHGNMCVGVSGDDLMVRVGPDAYAEALAQPHAREMDFTGKPLRGFVYVDPLGLESDEDLEAWIERGARFARSLPAR